MIFWIPNLHIIMCQIKKTSVIHVLSQSMFLLLVSWLCHGMPWWCIISTFVPPSNLGLLATNFHIFYCIMKSSIYTKLYVNDNKKNMQTIRSGWGAERWRWGSGRTLLCFGSEGAMCSVERVCKLLWCAIYLEV